MKLDLIIIPRDFGDLLKPFETLHCLKSPDAIKNINQKICKNTFVQKNLVLFSND